MVDLAGMDVSLAKVSDELTVLRGDAGVWWMGGMAKDAGMEKAVRDIYESLDRALASINAARNRLAWADMERCERKGR